MTTTRRAGAASAAALTGLALTLGLAHAAAPRWVQRLGLDVWNVGAARESLREAEERDAELRARKDRTFQSIECGGHTGGRLAEGSITLAEAADLLAPLLAERPGFATAWRVHYGAPTFRHGVARYAILRARDALADDPARWAAVAPLLEAQYAAMK
jgi:hypothetical protein